MGRDANGTLSCPHLDSMPRMDVVFHDPSPAFVFAWVFASLLASVAFFLAHRHRAKLASCPGTRRRDLYIHILTLGPVFTFCGLVSLFSPRGAALWNVVEKGFEARTLYYFGLLLINFVAGENEHDPREARRKYVSTLQQLPPARYLGVPPFGLCFRCGPLGKPQLFSERLSRWVEKFMVQFLYIGPFMAMTELWITTQCDDTLLDSRTFVLICRCVGILSIMLAVWGLFIIYGATRDILLRYRTTLKFLAIKGVLLLTGCQDLLITTLFRMYRNDESDSKFDNEFLARFWISFAICVEGFVLTLLLVKTFSVEDLVGLSPDKANAYGQVKNQPTDDEAIP